MRLAVLCAVAVCAAGCGPAQQQLAWQDAALIKRIDASLVKTAGFLLARQSPDSAWRSSVYGIYRDGPSLTPHVASIMPFLPQGGPATAASFEAAVKYLVGLLDEKGLPRGDVELIYPVYTSATCSALAVKTSRTPQRLIRKVLVDNIEQVAELSKFQDNQ